MRDHIKSIHEGIKEYKCEYCGKEFDKKNNLKKHIIGVHEESTENYNFVCDFCAKRFYSSSHLKRHVLQHHSENKEKCPICGKTFSVANVLRRHIKIIHEGVGRKTCEICHKEFNWHSALKRHMKSHHNIEMKTKKLKPRSTEKHEVSDSDPKDIYI